MSINRRQRQDPEIKQQAGGKVSRVWKSPGMSQSSRQSDAGFAGCHFNKLAKLLCWMTSVLLCSANEIWTHTTNHVCSLGDTPIIRLPAVSKLRAGLQYSNKNEQKCDLTKWPPKKSTFNRCKTRYDLQGTRQVKNAYEAWRWTLRIAETSFFLPLVCPKGSENVAFFAPQVFQMLVYLWSCEVSCFPTLLSVHVCGALPADGSRCSVGVLRLIMDWVCGTHLTLKAYQLHSGWQPPYPQSIIPTKRRSSCWGNRALSVLLKGPFNITSCEWIALNCLTRHNTPILFHV